MLKSQGHIVWAVTNISVVKIRISAYKKLINAKDRQAEIGNGLQINTDKLLYAYVFWIGHKNKIDLKLAFRL